MDRIGCFHCHSPGSIPGQGTKIPHAQQQPKTKIKYTKQLVTIVRGMFVYSHQDSQQRPPSGLPPKKLLCFLGLGRLTCSLVPPCLCMCYCFSLQCLPFWVYLAKSVRCSVMSLFDPMAPLSMRIFQERMLEWVAIPFSRGIFPTQGLNPGLPHCRQILSHQGSRYQMGTKAIVLYSFWKMMMMMMMMGISGF